MRAFSARGSEETLRDPGLSADDTRVDETRARIARRTKQAYDYIKKKYIKRTTSSKRNTSASPAHLE